MIVEKSNENYTTNISVLLDIVKRLAQYEDLDKNGLLLKLPCAIGTTIYCLEDIHCPYCRYDNKETGKCDHDKNIDECPTTIIERQFTIDYLSSVAKDWFFLTIEEAEQHMIY